MTGDGGRRLLAARPEESGTEAVVREHTVGGAGAGDPDALPVGHASAGLFPMLGLPMALGRLDPVVALKAL